MMEEIERELETMEGQYWLCGLCGFVATSACCVMGPVMDAHGPFWLCVGASCMTAAYPFILAKCSGYWHFMVCIGLWGGIAKGLCMAVAAPMSAKVFKKRLGLAQAMIMSGSSLGGVVYSQQFKFIFPKMSWGNSMHFYGFLLASTSFFAFLLSLAYHWVVPEDSLQVHGGQQKSFLEDYCSWKKPFRNKAFLYFAGAMAVLVLGVYGMCVITPEVASPATPQD